jgi:hypothetical protein
MELSYPLAGGAAGIGVGLFVTNSRNSHGASVGGAVGNAPDQQTRTRKVRRQIGGEADGDTVGLSVGAAPDRRR